KHFQVLLFSLIVGSRSPNFPAVAAEHSPSALEGVAALEKPVTHSETKIPLGELVQKVAAETGVTLRTSRDVADEPIAVVVKDLPARVLLEQLADLLDYRWARRQQRAADGPRPGPDPPRPASGQQPAPEHSISATPEAPPFVCEIYQDQASKQREQRLRQTMLQ